MNQPILYVGIDVDDEAFHGYVTRSDGSDEQAFRCKPSVGVLTKRLKQLKKHIPDCRLKVCYEATYLGFSLQRELAVRGFECEVIAPSLIPRTPGHCVKTDRLDCKKLAQFYRGGLLTVVSIPDLKEEVVRDLTRSRRFLVNQNKALKLHILSICRRMGLNYKESVGRPQASYWTQTHIEWLNSRVNESEFKELSFNLQMLLNQMEQSQSQVELYDEKIDELSKEPRFQKPVEALCCYRGIDTLSAMTLVTELGDIRRFDHPRRLTSFAGMDLREYSSGGKEHRMSLSKMGNKWIRTTVVEACQLASQLPKQSRRLKEKRQKADPALVKISNRCMDRLYQKSNRLLHVGKSKNKVKVACARELLGFIWESLRVVAEMKQMQMQMRN